MKHWKRWGWLYMGGSVIVNVVATIGLLASSEPAWLKIVLTITNLILAVLMCEMAFKNYNNREKL